MSVGLKISLAATVILALSIVGVLAAERFDSANQDDAVQARETGGAEEPGDDVEAAGKPLKLGTVAKISSDYRVAVTEVSRYDLAKGQLIVATVGATYIGKQDGEPWADLDVEFFGSGSRGYGESDCPAGLDHTEASDQPALATGDKGTYDVCIEVPVKDIKGGKILVEEAFSTDDRTFWSTKEAVTKTLPSAAPSSPATHAPSSRQRPRRQPTLEDRCDDVDVDKIDDYREWGDSVKKRFEAYKDAGGDDEDKIDDYEDWKDEYDKRMDMLEKLDEICD